MYILVSRYTSCAFSEDDITVFLRRVSRPEKVVGLPEVRQLVPYRVWLSLTGRLAYFSLCFLQHSHLVNQCGKRNKETLVFRNIDLFLECLKLVNPNK